jgi:hypothetical protein
MKQLSYNIRNERRLTRFFKWIRKKISDLFEPEEVEVTFKQEGNKVSYTYTKVEHKQVA